MSRESQIAEQVIKAVFPEERVKVSALYDGIGECIDACGFSLVRMFGEDDKPTGEWSLDTQVFVPGNREQPDDWDLVEIATGRFDEMLVRLVQESAKQGAEAVLENIGLEEYYNANDS